MASMRKLKGKFYIRIRYNGKEKLIPTFTGIKRDAEIILKKYKHNEQEVKLNLAEHLLDRNFTIKDSINYFKKRYQAEKGIENSTLKSYLVALNDFNVCFGSKTSINELKRDNYHELINYLNIRLNPVTVNIRLRSIRTFFNYLLESEKIKKLPFKISQVKIDQSPPKYLLPSELEQIYSLIEDEKLLATYKTFEVTGMRVGELQHSNRDGNFIIITKTKTGRERNIPIADDDIKNYDLARFEPYSTSWITRNFTKYAKQVCKSKITAHSLRHTFAYRSLLKTDNIQLVRDLLGHTSIKTTQIYTQIPKEYLKKKFTDILISKSENISIHARA